MKKSTQWLLGSVLGSMLIWSCSAQQLATTVADQAKKAGASTLPGTVASALPSAAASQVPSALPSVLPSALPSALPAAIASALASAQPSAVASAIASAQPSTVPLPSSLVSLIPDLLSSGTSNSTSNCAAVLQCAVNIEPSLATNYNPLIAKPGSIECTNAAIGATFSYPQCKK